MNTQHGLFYLIETLSSLRNGETKPASGEASPEVETKLLKLDCSLLTRRPAPLRERDTMVVLWQR
ncbi:MAG: hypothetical protein JO232_04400 [Verrucomicrobia bacterium]|nr:hypothetical protein [Verrucomicrobiota bacterium]